MPDIDFAAVAGRFAKASKEEQYRQDPVLWAEDKCGAYVWSKQAEVMRSVVNHKRTLVASCHASGKTRLASWLTGWWADTHPKDPVETRIVTTAPSWVQVRGAMWGYVEEVQKAAKVGGRINGKAEWYFDGFKTPTAFGRKPSDYDESTFQGIHPTYAFVVIDEAGGVPESIFTSVETITTNRHARILAIANPDDPTSYMAKIWHEQSKLKPKDRDWNLITITAFDTPNFTGESVPEKLKDNLLQHSWVDDARKRWGEDDPRYVAKVLAQFPEIGQDGLFNLGKVLQSMNTYDEFEQTHGRKTLGVDVGLSETGDFSVIAMNDGGKVTILDKVKGYDANRLSQRVGQRCQEYGVEVVNIDGIGIGKAVKAVAMNWIPANVEVNYIIGNEASPNKYRWFNFRAAMYDQLSTKVNTASIAIPPDEKDPERTAGLYDEFRLIHTEWRGSAMLIEGKDSLRKHGGHSPDVLDAIAYASLDLHELFTNEDDDYIDSDTIINETQNEFWVDDWGNEPWSFAPA